MKFDLRRSIRARNDRVKEAHSQYTQGRLSRREFLRFSAALGAGAVGVNLLSPFEQLQVRRARAAQGMTPVRGGTIFSGAYFSTSRFDDPARLDSVFASNNVRQVCDYLVTLDADLVLRPSLAESWTPSEDGLTWTFTLRQGVKFNHGKTFNADDVVFTINRLVNPDTSSAFAGAASYVTGAEKVDDYTVNIFTNRVAADFVYTLFLYVAAILPADWPGDFFANPWGTGPFTITDFVPDERIRFERRDDYWGLGADGQALPYLDAVEFVSYQDDLARLNAMAEGSIQLSNASAELREQYSALSGVSYVPVQTGNLDIAVMKYNEEPWTDPRIREAFKLCFDRQTYIDTRFLGLGIPADDHPIAPGMYPLSPADQSPRQQNYEQARQLLSEAGFADGFDLTLLYIDPQSDGGYTEPFAVFMASQLEPAGIRVTLQPDPDYWGKWLADWGPFHLGASNWSQKNTASEMFNLAYRSGAVWNETHWSNEEFDNLLTQFDQELDQEKRAGQLKQMTDLLRNEGPVMIPAFRQDAAAMSEKLHYRLHPQSFVWMGDAWLET
ncbi:MAG: ABC transporter substrate-binding protein [Anaerolineae bacterium]|nr:ABC transporter substrate-binding protein [Anaerolineae bacterium]